VADSWNPSRAARLEPADDARGVKGIRSAHPFPVVSAVGEAAFTSLLSLHPPPWIFLHSLQIDPDNCAPDPGSPDWPGQAVIAANSVARAEPEQVSSKYWFLDPAFHLAFFNYYNSVEWIPLIANCRR
jgi:hypothetical protein